ncbi:MAG: phenylalanine--tRNA ligase subunit beta, partial [Paludibacteraceae bacterium]|nr:phenylalanine--tRNA ligase subunit beta [Paludibacteraceae bacterium]
TYRVDVTRDVDVIEDILRIYGYNNIELDSSVRSSMSHAVRPDSYKMQNIVANQLTSCGFNEILNNSLTKVGYYEDLKEYTIDKCVSLMNPLSQDLGVMRQTMLFGGLESIAYNRNRRNLDLKFYEFGNCYYFNTENKSEENVLSAYSEDFHLALWLCGNKTKESWVRAEEKTTIYELKAYVENLLRRLGVSSFIYDEFENELYTKALSISVNKGGKIIATIGSVSSKILKKMDIDTEVFYADINWNYLLKALKKHKVTYAEISKFPEVKRDFALLVDNSVKFADIERIAFESERKILKSVNLFDVYEGKNLEAGKKSYAVSFILQDETKTLADKQIDAIMSKIQANLEKQLGAKLR